MQQWEAAMDIANKVLNIMDMAALAPPVYDDFGLGRRAVVVFF